MMVTQVSTETGLLNLISELRAHEKQQELELDETRRNIDAVQRALELLREKYGHPPGQPDRKPQLETLRGMTLQGALVEIAKANYGSVRVKDAKRLLLESGNIGNPKTAYQRITATLIRSEHFERSAPGIYILIAAARGAAIPGRPISFQAGE